jgi:hypothetical protein
MTKRPEPNPLVMLNLFQHLVGFFLLSADASFIPVPAYRQAGTGRGFQMQFNKSLNSGFVYLVYWVEDERLTEKWAPLKSASRQGHILSCCAQSTWLLGHDPAGKEGQSGFIFYV